MDRRTRNGLLPSLPVEARILLWAWVIVTRVTGGRWPGMTWLTLAAAAAVVAINLVGFWEITTARRDVIGSARRTMALTTAARAGAIEARLAQARGDLAFMAGSPVFFELEEVLVSRDERMARFRRLEAEGALLLFLRGHPEVMRAAVRGANDRPILEAARRGGIPVLWTEQGEGPRRNVDPVEQPVEGRFEPRLGTRTVRGAVTIDVTIDAARLLSAGRGTEDNPACVLADASGAVLAADPGGGPGRTAGNDRDETASAAPVAAEGWSVTTPWSLSCRAGASGPLALLDPLAARYRSTLLLNLMVMSLAVGLGGFAIHQARRRREMEATAREEARVRELERRLFHAERLSTVGRLAAGMAHEINNPLEGMSNYMALARDSLARGDLPDAERSLTAATEGLRRVSGVVGQVLAHADPKEAPVLDVDILATARETLAFVGGRPEFSAIRFDVDLPEGIPKVKGRPVLLGQVLLNLLLNACEAQPRGGEVRVAARRAADRVVLEIADRGPGVPPAEASRIFEPFYSTKDSSGLGLSVCHAIVTTHGGTIAVEERPGGGASFRIDLPASGGTDERD
jgi:signal transduction histidine kinase